MKRLSNRYHHLSIQHKLVLSFVMGALLLAFINAIVYVNLEQMVGQIDGVYSSNLELNDISEKLDAVENSLYQYLETKSSQSLEEYYVCVQDYREVYVKLNIHISDSDIAIIEKNIYHISESYLQKADDTIFAKRGRDVTGYKEGYAQCQKLYQYLRDSIRTLNTDIFLQNSENYSLLRKNLNFLILAAVVLLGSVIVVMISWIIFVTKSITRPLIELAGAANEIALGNMEVGFPFVDTGDEITIVAKACNKMIDSIRRYIDETKENYEREAKHVENELIMQNDLKEAQLKYLQAQINPHFLFNTLNAGAQLAMMEGAEKTCIFIGNMADFFRYNVRKIGQDTTLAEELELVDNYLYILNVRFAGEIHYQKQVNEKLISLKMPSMILQPIVENAVNHGIRNMEGEGVITLQVYREDGRTYVEIADNGSGISEEKIVEIMNESESEREGQSTIEEDAGSGIGLRNVISRLNRYYEKEDIFEIKNNESGPGTTVRLCI